MSIHDGSRTQFTLGLICADCRSALAYSSAGDKADIINYPNAYEINAILRVVPCQRCVVMKRNKLSEVIDALINTPNL